MAKSKKKQKKKEESNEDFVTNPLVALTEVAPLPGLVVPLFLSDKKSLKAVEVALEEGLEVVLSYQIGDPDASPKKSTLSRVAATARILQTVKMSGGDYQVDFHVVERTLIHSFVSATPYFKVLNEPHPKPMFVELSEDDEKRVHQVRSQVEALAAHDPVVQEHLEMLTELYDPGELADLVSSVLSLEPAEAQRILEEFDGSKRLELASAYLEAQLEVQKVRNRINGEADNEVKRAKHQELLREQMRLIRTELGEGSDFDEELSTLSDQLQKSKMPAKIRQVAQKQLRRLQQLYPDTSEAALARTYIDWIIDLPWATRSKDNIDLTIAAKVLEEDHYGLSQVKERILDFLGVRKIKKDHRGPVLLFVGPPGVGKTSLGRSIARALGRKFVRISVGGLRDEAELRGHRRTYVGALPGRIIQGLKTAGTCNPVFLLDEIDKIGSDFRGDPSSVLLEVLDPAQNSAFEDHYLNLPYDLSEVMFICTANVVDSIPAPLLDRMETIEVSGYTPQEKLQIAKRYLVPQEAVENGVQDLDIALGDKTLHHVMNGYTRESGVREFRRKISTIFRKVARMVAEETEYPKVVTPKMVQKMLGPVEYIPDKRQENDEIGVVTGLAWTSVGGETLTVEVTITKGKGSLSLTGQLGEVMRESAQTALTYVLSRAGELGIDPNFYENSNVHVHVPQGAIPKDGPSAGIAMATAFVSVLTDRPVSRFVAMTGEITLRGSVLPIGGLKEKALAALRTGMKKVIIPKENERELVEFPKYLLDAIEFVAAESLDDVLAVALLDKDDLSASGRRTTVKRPMIRK